MSSFFIPQLFSWCSHPVLCILSAWEEWPLAFVRVAVFQRQMKTSDPPLFGTLTLYFCHFTSSELWFTGHNSQVWFGLMCSSPDTGGGQNITTCKTHQVGLLCPTCVYLVVYVWWWGERTLTEISRNLRMKKKVWVRKGDTAPARLSFHEAGWPQHRRFLIHCRARAPAAQAVSHSHSQPLTSSTFSHCLAQAPGSVPKPSEEIIPQSGIN